MESVIEEEDVDVDEDKDEDGDAKKVRGGAWDGAWDRGGRG